MCFDETALTSSKRDPNKFTTLNKIVFSFIPMMIDFDCHFRSIELRRRSKCLFKVSTSGN